MTYYNNLLLGFLSLLILLSSCRKEEKYLNRTYKGVWDETMFKYTFKLSGKFIFKTDGHYGKLPKANT